MNKLNEAYLKIEEKTKFKSEMALSHFNLADHVLCTAFIRNLQFNLTISRNQEDNLYFYLPILRGLCEDIIFINYLFSIIEESDRHNFVLVYQYSDLIKSVKAQELFFSENKNVQPIITKKIVDEVAFKNVDVPTIHQALKSKYNWQRKFPTVKQIAQDGGLSYLYDFLYAATSRLVHFNPQTLLQMVWGKFDMNQKPEVEYLNISIDNFKPYYNQFCKFYGFQLFEIFVDKFSSELAIEITEEVDSLKNQLKNGRWPELITHEELNIDGHYMAQKFYEEKHGITEEQYLKAMDKLNEKK